MITDTDLEFMTRWNTIVPPRPTYSAHWGSLLKSSIAGRSSVAAMAGSGGLPAPGLPWPRRPIPCGSRAPPPVARVS